ncbi:biotin/lipoyl-binding protein [Cohaesibacter intestini]|uniref:biotin/lipoyl-binding protein n=1 Tax=Cohaesibacter intestini TaxID=2211145 RepID=UPI0013006024|nr:biotin/lipoyl-binding protein [Cohaesibacter intestini]
MTQKSDIENLEQDVETVIKWAKQNKLEALGVEVGDLRVRVMLQDPNKRTKGLALDEADLADAHLCRAASQGIWHFHHADADKAVLLAGQPVPASMPLGYLTIGPMLLPVTSPVAGTLTAVFVDNGDMVAAGSPLFAVRPNQ